MARKNPTTTERSQRTGAIGLSLPTPRRAPITSANAMEIITAIMVLTRPGRTYVAQVMDSRENDRLLDSNQPLSVSFISIQARIVTVITATIQARVRLGH